MNIMLSEYQTSKNGKFNAISKARNDAIKICRNQGFEVVPLYVPGCSKIRTITDIVKGCFLASKNAGPMDNIILQYPHNYTADKFVFFIMAIMKVIKHFKLCVLIHDIDSLRPFGSTVSDTRSEIKLFEKTTGVICHTEAMKELLLLYQPQLNCKVLGPFYYLTDAPFVTRKCNDYNKKRIVIAGNLTKEKAGYIYEIPTLDNSTFNLYGVGVEEKELPSNVKYMGKYDPEELVEKLDGEYGLVWDGESVNTCAGQCGEYLKINSPHKLSLYIAACLPIIIWDESALAKFVVDNRIGFAIHSITEIDEIKVSKVQYETMINNLKNIRDSIVHGINLTAILDELCG